MGVRSGQTLFGEDHPSLIVSPVAGVLSFFLFLFFFESSALLGVIIKNSIYMQIMLDSVCLDRILYKDNYLCILEDAPAPRVAALGPEHAPLRMGLHPEVRLDHLQALMMPSTAR